MPKIADGVGFVHVTDPETSEVTVYGPGDDVAKEHEDLVGKHCFVAGEIPASEVGFVAGPSQGLGGLSEEDQALLEKARKAEASRRSRAAKADKAEAGEGGE